MWDWMRSQFQAKHTNDNMFIEDIDWATDKYNFLSMLIMSIRRFKSTGSAVLTEKFDFFLRRTYQTY
jgi:hypothetical protein